MSNWKKFPVLFSLYIAQSVPMSFFSTVVPVIMRQENYSLESIGLLQLVKLPWIIKFLWAPLVDKTAGKARHYKSWIILSELFYAAIIISIAFMDLQTDFRLIVIFMVVAFIASATQDIATDAYAILILKRKERSIGNSMQSAGSFTGALLGTGVLLIAYYYFGWRVLLLILSLFVMFAIIPLLLYRKDNNQKTARETHQRVSLADIYRFFAVKGMHKRVLILVFYYSGIIGILAMLKPYMVDLGYSVKQIGFMSGIIGTSVAAIAAFLSGYIIKVAGRKLSIYLFAFVNFLAALFFFYISTVTPGIVSLYAAICLVWGAYGLSTVIIYTTSMDVVRKGREGTDFTVQIVLTHLSGMIIAIMSGKAGDAMGYTGLFGLEAALALFTLILLLYAVPKNLGNGDI
ncbi:MAG TPA: MFS transporter [Bacteroidales bacterium]|nr:MFS transporter [Bacteroidales bacterium]